MFVLEYKRIIKNEKRGLNIFNFKNHLKDGKRNFVFLGETGSGKTEISLVFANEIKKIINKEIHIIDMDQTKASFRLRDKEEELRKNGIYLHYGEQLLDTPIVPHGIETLLQRKDIVTIFDVGGNEAGSINMGQYSNLINNEYTKNYMVFNIYRPMSSESSKVYQMLDSILDSAQAKNIEIIANPNFGEFTEKEDVLSGYKKTLEVFRETNYEVKGVAVKEELVDTDLLYAYMNKLMTINRRIIMP